jgi:hypothetical protein
MIHSREIYHENKYFILEFLRKHFSSLKNKGQTPPVIYILDSLKLTSPLIDILDSLKLTMQMLMDYQPQYIF